VRRLAEQGLVALAFTNSPAAMPVPGGRRPLMGTNPIAAAFPRRAAPPLVIDMALSEVARGKIMVAAKAGRPIPEGWALDAEGRPTTDPKAALSGAMLAMGGSKGALLALGWVSSDFLLSFRVVKIVCYGGFYAGYFNKINACTCNY
jgi:(2R)-3-sulfolactate dehydrogenase (NADP+)